VQVLVGSEASAPAERTAVFVVHGRERLAAEAAYLPPVLSERGIRHVVVLPERGEPETEVGQDVLDLLTAADVLTLSLPSAADFWPEPRAVRITLEGAFRRHGIGYRPGHYADLVAATIRLLGLFRQPTLYTFASDYHWLAIWTKVQEELLLPGRQVFLPPPREPDGLLVSPENRRLTAADRLVAAQVYRTLGEAQELFRQGEVEAPRLLGRTSAKLMRVPGYRVQYLSLVEPTTLAERDVAQPGDVLLVGGFFGAVRLEDYLVLDGRVA
jgi:pantothenate synthetase